MYQNTSINVTYTLLEIEPPDEFYKSHIRFHDIC